jgi:hypothetical protein
MKYISLAFNEDVHRDEIAQFKAVPGCTGVSSYKNTVNVYFRTIDRPGLRSLAVLLQRQLATTGNDVQLANATINSADSRQSIYEALREEAEN